MENGDACYCGNNDSKFMPAPKLECNRPCSGNETQICGAAWRLNVYDVRRFKRSEGNPEDHNLDLSCLNHHQLSLHPSRPNPEWLPPNDCCGELPYNTNVKVGPCLTVSMDIKKPFQMCCKPENILVEIDSGCQNDDV